MRTMKINTAILPAEFSTNCIRSDCCLQPALQILRLKNELDGTIFISLKTSFDYFIKV